MVFVGEDTRAVGRAGGWRVGREGSIGNRGGGVIRPDFHEPGPDNVFLVPRIAGSGEFEDGVEDVAVVASGQRTRNESDGGIDEDVGEGIDLRDEGSGVLIDLPDSAAAAGDIEVSGGESGMKDGFPA